MQKIVIGSDHAGYEMKEKIKKAFSARYEFTDKGTFSADSVDYPDYAHQVALSVESGEFEKGILLCGSGNGVAMAANKHHGIRAALCWTPEIAELARQHNNANILCIPARFVDDKTAFEIVERFFEFVFEGGRHQRRVDKIDC
ncbi:MAG: ribose 5-phosphate isomerase B [Bacteroidetes bacterium]|jgi:ribose 5-phosphate isomerase B|nr:ribose 5-phosphate isomerase B [Bacteroidota bacterium]